jgi:isopentenyldiphosphate isomerase
VLPRSPEIRLRSLLLHQARAQEQRAYPAKQTNLMCHHQRRIPLDINPIGSACRYMAG